MLEYWIQNGECQAEMHRNANVGKILKDTIFRRDGSLTCLSRSLFSMLNPRGFDDVSQKLSKSLKTLKVTEKKTCSFCGSKGASRLKGWMFPFIIDQAKFPNIYPNGKVESLNICKSCLVKSLQAYGAILYSGQQGARNTIHINAIMFFSNDSSSLADFMRTSCSPAIIVDYFTNWKPKIRRDVAYFPYEFLMQMLDYVASKMIELGGIDELGGLGAVLICFSQTGRSKKIYECAEVVTALSPLVQALSLFNEGAEESRFFSLFRSMRKEIPKRKVVADAFVERNKFFRMLLSYRKIDWTSLEDIVFYRLTLDRSILYLDRFLKEVMKAMSDPDAQYYDQVSRQGWLLGSSLLRRGERPKAVKASIYELRRERSDLGKFLDLVNDLQLKAESGFDDRIFRENERVFTKLRTFFLIGMSNALFQRSRESEKGDDR